MDLCVNLVNSTKKTVINFVEFAKVFMIVCKYYIVNALISCFVRYIPTAFRFYAWRSQELSELKVFAKRFAKASCYCS